MTLPRETPVTIVGRDKRRHVVPGRPYRGLAMVRPYDLRRDPIEPVPQRAARPCWGITHLESGLGIGSIWGRVRAAWAEFCRIAEAADWDRPMAEVLADPDCIRVHEDLRRAANIELWGKP
jgi:hypothetical protein